MEKETKTANAKHIFIDIVNYTYKRSVEAQSDLINKLNEIVLKVIESKNISSENIVYIPTGDGMCISLLDLFTPYDIHIEIAKDILSLLYEHNQIEMDQMRQFNIRIGINENLDNIITDINGNTNVSGSGINHAARIEGIGDANQIIVGNSVYEILVQREKYMNAFQTYNKEVKHGLILRIHQLIDLSNKSLNSNTPSMFASIQKDQKLNQLQAYYIGLCLKHEKFITEKMELQSHRIYCISVLLIYMAMDSVARSRKTKSNPDPSYKIKGTMIEFYDEICNVNFWVICDLAVALQKENFSTIANCFEEPYLFVNEKGKDKLKKEHPNIYQELELK